MVLGRTDRFLPDNNRGAILDDQVRIDEADVLSTMHHFLHLGGSFCGLHFAAEVCVPPVRAAILHQQLAAEFSRRQLHSRCSETIHWIHICR